MRGDRNTKGALPLGSGEIEREASSRRSENTKFTLILGANQCMSSNEVHLPLKGGGHCFHEVEGGIKDHSHGSSGGVIMVMLVVSMVVLVTVVIRGLSE